MNAHRPASPPPRRTASPSLHRAAWLGAVAVIGLATSACVETRRAAASPDEYAIYRRTRAADALEDRLEAAQRYIARYPEGAWAPEVNAFFDHAEPLYFLGARASIPALEAYLRALPHGPNAKEATLRLRDLRAAEKADRTDLTGTAVTAAESAARETERRGALRERLGVWLGLFLDPAVFTRPMADAKAPLVVPWSLGLPWPRCERPEGPEAPRAPAGGVRRCTKLLQLDYRAMEGGDAQERQALVEIAMWQDEEGRPVEVSIGGPDLFLRLQETVTARAASATDPEAKLQGAERAVEVAQEAFDSVMGREKTCKKTADNDVLRLSCKGMTLRVLAGALDGEDDRFVLRAAP